MNSAPIPPHIRVAAQEWFVRLQSFAPSNTAYAAFERWIAADPLHADAYRAVKAIWLRAGVVTEDTALDDILQEARRLPPEPTLVRRAWPTVAAAACLVLALWSSHELQRASRDAPAVTYATATGEQRSVYLKDGSIVLLDTRSELQVLYKQHERRLRLLSGQADFQVAHDAERPFVVQAGGSAITATGTRFQVRLGEGVGMVTLLQGRVIVDSVPEAQRLNGNTHSGEQRIALQPGERLAFGPDGGLGMRKSLTDTELAQVHGWLEGTLVVREWPLSRLLEEMNRYTEVPYRLQDPGLGELLVSGSFRPDDRESFLLSLEYGWPIEVDRDRVGEIVLRSK